MKDSQLVRDVGKGQELHANFEFVKKGRLSQQARDVSERTKKKPPDWLGTKLVRLFYSTVGRGQSATLKKFLKYIDIVFFVWYNISKKGGNKNDKS